MNKMLWPDLPVMMVDDDQAILRAQENLLRLENVNNLVSMHSGSDALAYLETHAVEMVVLDLSMPDISGHAIQEKIRSNYPEVPIIIVTASSDLQGAIDCMRRGSFDYLLKPVEPLRFVSAVVRALETKQIQRDYRGLKAQLLADPTDNPTAFSAIVTSNPTMRRLFKYAESLAPSREAILIRGETGVGKDLFAEAIHKSSNRVGKFIAVNIGGLDDAFFSDTLFGHRKGAFTGAIDHREGMIARASGGTLFLDEIGDLDMASQIKLIRLLENHEYLPLGSDMPVKTDARMIFATHLDLEKLCGQGKFRRDLYYRVSTYELTVPALRDRPEDIFPLFNAFVDQARAESPETKLSCDPKLAVFLKTFPFPGNVRQLRSIAFRAAGMARAQNMNAINIDLLKNLEPFASLAMPEYQSPPTQFNFGPTLPTVREIQAALIAEALRRSDGNQTKAAGLIGLSVQALNNRLIRSRGSDHG